jgi:rhodanese-related sulfurtransferase
LATVEKRIWKHPSRRASRAAVVLLVAAALAAQGCAMLRRRAAERPPYRKVTPPIAYEMIRDTPGILILDLRSPEAFHGDTGHIYKAYNIPQDRLPFRLLELSSFREETFLVYCDTGKCGDDGMVILVSSGFENAILIDGGIDGWIAKGFRTVLPEELAGRTRQAGQAQGPATEDREESPPAQAAAQPAMLQQAPGTTLPAICPEPHVQVQKPPR